MELGSLKGAGANFAHSNFACTNLARANLSKANLDGSDFRGAFLGGTDLRGATLGSNANFYLTNISWVQFDAATKIDRDSLKCACVQENKGDDGKLYRQIQPNLPSALSEMLNQIKICPARSDTCEDEVQRNWKCIE
jgi:Pentapeptide repeats (8 copies)